MGNPLAAPDGPSLVTQSELTLKNLSREHSMLEHIGIRHPGLGPLGRQGSSDTYDRLRRLMR